MAYDAVVSLEESADRVSAAAAAGQKYTDTMEQIRDDLRKDDNSGTTLSAMIGAQVSITEAESAKAVEEGIPNNMSKAVKTSAQAVKQAAG